MILTVATARATLATQDRPECYHAHSSEPYLAGLRSFHGESRLTNERRPGRCDVCSGTRTRMIGDDDSRADASRRGAACAWHTAYYRRRKRVASRAGGGDARRAA